MISAGRGVTMELEIILVFHCNPCQFIFKKIAWWHERWHRGRGEGRFPQVRNQEGTFPRKKNICMIFFKYVSKIVPVWHALTFALVVVGICSGRGWNYNWNIFKRARRVSPLSAGTPTLRCFLPSKVG